MMKRFVATAETIAAAMLLAVALLTASNAALRYTAAIQIPDWFDFSRLLQAIALFWGIAIVTYRGTHICVDIVWELLGRRGRQALDIAATACMVLALAPMTWMVWQKVATTGSQATSDLRLPLAPFYGIAAVGITVGLVLALKRLWMLARGDDAARMVEGTGGHGP
jgi:TRAP-type C4-dicarboxylate transport system permease small subunit